MSMVTAGKVTTAVTAITHMAAAHVTTAAMATPTVATAATRVSHGRS